MKLVSIMAIFMFAGAASASCPEGRRQAFTEQQDDHNITVIRTCTNGTYMTAAERAAYVRNPTATCKEGARQVSHESDPNGDKQITVIRVCRNGSYMTAAERAGYVRNPDNRCAEGAIRMFYETEVGEDTPVMRRYVCVSGKYRKAN